MRSSARKKVATITAAAFIMVAVTTLTMMATSASVNAGSSVRVTQSGDDDGSSSVVVTQSNGEGVEVSCEGDVNCEVIGDDTVVATSEDGDSTSNTAVTTSNTDTTTTVNQPDLDALGDRIEGMVDRLLDEVSASLANWRVSLFT